MRKLWRNFLALSLGMLATGAYAQEAAWKPTPSPAASLGAPIASSRPAAVAPAPAPAPPPAAGGAAVIGRPVAIASSRPEQTRPAAPPTAGGPVARGSSAETTDVMPAGPVNPAVIYPGLHSWRRAEDGLMLTSRAVVSPSNGGLPAPTPINAPMAPMPVGPPAGPYGGPPLVGPYSSAPPLPGPPGGPVLVSPGAGVPSIYATAPGVPCGPACGPTCAAPACGAPPCTAPTCGAPAIPSCGCGCPPGNIWFVGIEYLMWIMKGDITPPLVTQNASAPAILGQPGTRVLYGGEGVGDQTTSGARLTAGMWFSDAHCWGIEFSGFFLGENSDHFTATSFGENFLARPFTNVGAFRAVQGTLGLVRNIPGSPDAERVGDSLTPLQSFGRVDVDRTSRLWGGEANLKRGLCCSDCAYFDLLAGFRVLGLDESLTISENLVVTDQTSGASSRFAIQDRFKTTNRFYGGQVGFDTEYRWNNWSFGARGKVGLGVTQQMSELTGSTVVNTINPAGIRLASQGGLLVQPGTNMGTHFRHPFTVVPELGLTVGYQIRPWCRFTVGYNFLYWSNVIRPGGTIDPAVNTAYLANAPAAISARTPGSMFTQPARPAQSFNGNDFWAQGLTLGLEFKF